MKLICSLSTTEDGDSETNPKTLVKMIGIIEYNNKLYWPYFIIIIIINSIISISLLEFYNCILLMKLFFYLFFFYYYGGTTTLRGNDILILCH